MYFVIPLAFFGVAFYWLFIGRFQAAPAAPAASVVAGSTSIFTNAVIGGTMVPGNNGVINLGGSFQNSVATRPPAAALRDKVDPITCFSQIDAIGVYSATQVLRDGMFLAEKSTRVLGGMIYNGRYGWYHTKDFSCTGDLSTIEVEWISPIPTSTITKAVVVVARSRTPNAPAVPSALPTNTPLPRGVVVWSVDSCTAQWLVWDVNAVFLNYAGHRDGVAGDNQGAPVVRNLCPYTGTVSIDVYNKDGTIERRSGTLK
jgi:hypothetical protein